MHMTKVYYDNWLARLILFKGYSTITLGPFILTKMKEGQLPDYAINEERIHVRQWKDCFTMGMIIAYFASFLFSAPYHWYAFLPFLLPFTLYYIMYLVEWLISFIHHVIKDKGKEVGESNRKAYYASSMEMEAKENRDNMDYLRTRPFGAFFRYYGRI